MIKRIRALIRPWRIRFFSRLSLELLQAPCIWGDPARVHIDPTAEIFDALLNVSSGEIWIGPNVFTGHRVMLVTGTHDYTLVDQERMKKYPTEGRTIRIESGAWLGSGAIILGPCTVGANAVVAAGAVVTSDVPANCLAKGIPAQYFPIEGGARSLRDSLILPMATPPR